MKVRALLKQVGITEMTYYALLQSNAVPFMRRRRKGQGGFQREHLLAMKAFALLRAHGLNKLIAGAAVEAAFPAICTFSSEGKLPSPAAYKVGARLFSLRGKVIAAPIDAPVQPGAEEVGRVELDLRGIATLLPPLTQE